MIQVENLSKAYGANRALDGISFQAKPGEILGLLGPNGAGKTTTMRILTGFMPPSGGGAIVAGHDILKDSLEVRKRVGYMPERVPFYPDMTVEGYLVFWARLRGVKKARLQAQEALDKVSLLDRRQSLVRNLSKGMKQRLGLAQALVHNPEVVILDEPTIGIDPQQVIEVRESVRALANTHTVLFSTHILSEAEQVCDRVVILNKGQVVAEGKPDQLRQKLEGGTSLYVEIGGADSEQIMKLLRGLPGVQQVEEQGSGYVVQAQEGIDLRAHLFDRVSKAGYTLLEVRPVAMTLEDMFLNIVSRTGRKGGKR